MEGERGGGDEGVEAVKGKGVVEEVYGVRVVENSAACEAGMRWPFAGPAQLHPCGQCGPSTENRGGPKKG